MKINKGVRVKRMRTKNINDPTANITTSCHRDTKLINHIFENKFPKSQIKKLIELSRKRIPSLSSDKDECEEMMHKINVIKASSKGKSGCQNIPQNEEGSIILNNTPKENNKSRGKSHLEIEDAQRIFRKRVQSHAPEQNGKLLPNLKMRLLTQKQNAKQKMIRNVRKSLMQLV